MTANHQPPTPLKRAIFEKGIKQKDLASVVGTTEARMSLIVNGLRPDPALAARIARHLGAKKEELWPT